MRTQSSFPLVGLALDTPVRSRRNRIPELEAAKAKIRRVVERATEAMVKVSGSVRDARHLKSHFDYISRNGKIEVETERGEVIATRDRLREEHRAWCDELGPPRSNERHTINIVLSMPAGTDTEAVRRATRAFAESVFGETNQYLMAVHHPGNDNDTKNPHAHLTVKARGYDGARLDPKKTDLQTWREVFAAKMRDQGYEVEATPRRTRGVIAKAARGRVLAIDDDEKRPGRGFVRLAKLREAADGLSGRSASENPYRNQIIATQKAVRASWLEGAAELEASSAPVDRDLGRKIRAFVAGLPLSLQDERNTLRSELLSSIERSRSTPGALSSTPRDRSEPCQGPER
ncbi:relaxase/mobilization nuclease domain-containing protein [Massilia soli]|uniref:Relaxase/mobilization nuclease domain-containing protein n=1 Tax=Massilia soli TaxID=2792854 RepID=A0ABS7SLY3_9BURK|nr:relaxase/mobilization nuclease domain-containing protein [Massilia soli]MBZ2207191.1 relaxase/mobilization nuclease domain-containing protein [Massilia soli]